MVMKPPPLKLLDFGKLDASSEADQEPHLLLDGYFDYEGAASGIATGANWLLLGPKGSGKSAVLEHLRLSWASHPDSFFDYWDLRNFPVNDVTGIQMGQSAGASRTQSAWELLLLLRVVRSLHEDQGRWSSKSFDDLHRQLVKAGLLQADWRSNVAEWSKSTFKIDLKIVSYSADRETRAYSPLELVAAIKAVIVEVSTDSRHVIALDGLDSFFFEATDEWTSLTGLVYAIAGLNQFFRRHTLRITVVAAMRSDIYDVLPGGDLNKLKPNSCHLDWSAKGIGASNNLWTLLNLKVGVRHPTVTDVVKMYLAGSISIGPHREMPEYLLDYTRLLPRDLIALMGYVQKAYGGTALVPEAKAKEAVGAYCEQYFVGEVFDNLAGLLGAERAQDLGSFRDALRTLPTRYFAFEDVVAELDGELDRREIKLLLRQMFNTGAIGIRNSHGLREDYYDFVYRKVSGAGFSTRHTFVLHNALVRAWNRPWR
ncbi:P-loop ATPase, Sll1717 family [Oerskovia sp. NPDC060338]|uniref:P-loop ATPase, Sll1717 family n=1 Tax=Oerskovia sp. NPDC060338 TaxID=3347100 RepID=UPI00364CE4FB